MRPFLVIATRLGYREGLRRESPKKAE